MTKSVSVAMVLFLFLILFVPSLSYPEVKEVIAEGEYVMGDGETMSVAEERAQRNAARHAAEQAGAFVKSYTEVKNMVLQSDVIEVVANHAMKISVLKKQRVMMGDAVRFYVQIKAVMSTEDIDDNLKKLQNDRSAVEAYKRLQADFDRQAREMEDLKKQLAGATAGEKKAFLVKISNEERIFKANLWLEESQKYDHPVNKIDWQRGIEAYTKAIELNPNLAQAYIGRGNLFGTLTLLHEKDWSLDAAWFDKALSDYDRALELDPKNPRAYYGRSQALDSKADAERTKDREFSGLMAKLEDLGKKLDKEKRKPNNREIDLILKINAVAHRISDKYICRALQDVDRAIALKPDEPRFYSHRASLYQFVDDCWIKQFSKGHSKASCDRAIHDMTKAIALQSALPQNPEYSGLAIKELAMLYSERSRYYKNSGDEALATKDWEENERLSKQGQAALDKMTESPEKEERNKEYKLKIEALTKAIAENPDDPLNYLDRAHSKVMMVSDGKYADVMNDLNRGIDLMEKKGAASFGIRSVSAYFDRSRFYRVVGGENERQYDREVQDLSRVIELYDAIFREELQASKAASVVDLVRSMRHEEERLRKAGREEEAFELTSKGYANDNFLKNAYQFRAEAFEKLGLPEKAQADYVKACVGWEDEKACKAAKRLQ